MLTEVFVKSLWTAPWSYQKRTLQDLYSFLLPENNVLSSEYGWWSVHLEAAAAKSLQLCLTLCDPMDCSLPGSSVRGILQARILKCHFLLQGVFQSQGLSTFRGYRIIKKKKKKESKLRFKTTLGPYSWQREMSCTLKVLRLEMRTEFLGLKEAAAIVMLHKH